LYVFVFLSIKRSAGDKQVFNHHDVKHDQEKVDERHNRPKKKTRMSFGHHDSFRRNPLLKRLFLLLIPFSSFF